MLESDNGGAGGEGGAGGAVSDAFGVGGGQSGGAGAAAGAGAGGEGGGDGSGQGGGAPSWIESFSGEAVDADTPSHRDWLTSKGFKSLDDVAKSYRETERALRSGNKIEVPKEGATPEQIASFHRAIGVPEKADGYEFKLPDGVEGELNTSLLSGFGEAAVKYGIPRSAAEALVRDWFIPLQLDSEAGLVAERQADTEAKFTEWGPAKDQNLALANRAAQVLGLDKSSIADIQKGYGAGRTLDLMKRLGEGLAEDAFRGGDGRQNFGISADGARAELDQMNADPTIRAKIAANDPATMARRERLMNALAAEQDRKARAA